MKRLIKLFNKNNIGSKSKYHKYINTESKENCKTNND